MLCQWGGTTKLAGNRSRSTTGPDADGSPWSTAIFAPEGRKGGAGPNLTWSGGVTM
jgi:hypothetical protein